MVNKLRRRIIAVAMISITLVLLLIVGSINIINYRNVVNTASQRLEMIKDNGGSLFKEDFKPEQNNFDRPQKDRNFGPEFAFETRFFSVTLTPDGTVSTTNIQSIAAISEDQAIEIALSLFQKDSSKGFYETYRYTKVTTDNGEIIYYFVDVQRELSTFTNFLWASIGISILGLILVFILVVIFSRFLTKPVVESYEKQKRFITDASHEIKTPLAIISANTEVIEMTGEENEWTSSIRHQVDRLTELTNRLVFLSRMEEANTRLNAFDFSLTDAFREETAELISLAQKEGHRVECQIDEGLRYHGDESYIRQVFSLLTENAIKYAKKPDTAEECSIRLRLYANGKNKVFTIWNKADISPGNHDELFERFYRSDQSRNSKTGGHGIGLSVAQAIVHAHKGKITAYSEDGKSILFTIII